MTSLLDLITSKKAVVGVIGLGYVGLPLVRLFAESGFQTIGFDIDESKVAKLNYGKSYILSVPDETLKKIGKSFKATTDFGKLAEADVIIICVPTPLTLDGKPDVSYIKSTAQTIAKNLRKGQLISLESTTYPGTTREVVLPILSKKGFSCGKDFYLVFSPEREDPGNKNFTQRTIPKVVGGCDKPSLEHAAALYSQVCKEVIKVSSAEAAEACKILENVYRCVNIALVNELKMLFDRMNIDIWEVINAAKTKPFGFQPFYPGPGWGGHCVAGNEFVYVDVNGIKQIVTLEQLYNKFRNGENKINDVNYIKPGQLKILSLDIESNKFVWKQVLCLTKRFYNGNAIVVTTNDNRRITVTDLHPMLVYDDGEISKKPAKYLTIGDLIPIYSSQQIQSNETSSPYINLFDHLDNFKFDTMTVRIKDDQWSNYSKILKENFGWHSRYYIRGNYLPISKFLSIYNKRKISVPVEKLILCTGKGSGHQKIPAAIEISPDFARFIGYYLSEGCITKDKSLRTRLTFNSNEKECIGDTIGILKNMGIRTSCYKDKKFNAFHIKVSSNLFSTVIKDILKAGRNSYNMSIPDIFFSLSTLHKENLLRGLLRGDGDVSVSSGKRTYSKNGKKYLHNNNSISIGYFTCSAKLLQQVTLILQEMNCIPSFKSTKPQIRLHGMNNAIKMKGFFADSKKEKLLKYLNNSMKIVKSHRHKQINGITFSNVANINCFTANDYFYSMEVEDTHNFVSSYAITVGNCIPIDPFYLSWRAREFDFTTRFIDLAGEINTQMPYYVVGRIEKKLGTIKDKKIMVIGVAYKKDIDDPRESPAFRVIEILAEKGAKLSYHDPFVPTLPKMRHFKYFKMTSKPVTKAVLSEQDVVLIITDHSNIDYDFIAKNSNLVVDTRNTIISKDKNILKA